MKLSPSSASSPPSYPQKMMGPVRIWMKKFHHLPHLLAGARALGRDFQLPPIEPYVRGLQYSLLQGHLPAPRRGLLVGTSPLRRVGGGESRNLSSIALRKKCPVPSRWNSLLPKHLVRFLLLPLLRLTTPMTRRMSATRFSTSRTHSMGKIRLSLKLTRSSSVQGSSRI